MKSIFTVLFILFASTASFTQSVFVNNGVCFFGGEFTLNGTENGRNRYTVGIFEIKWDGSQWIIRSTFGFTYATTSTNSSPNPPSDAFATANGTPYVADGTNCSGATFSVTGSGTQAFLPVELIRFEADLKKTHVTLKWSTASELNNEKFEIERSQDGREFQKIGEVEGKGTTSEQQEYSFEVERPRNGISYFRLKQIDFDGQFEISQVISVDFKGENGDVGEFYPNPSKSGIVNLDYTSQTDDEISITVFDVTGKLVVNQIQQVSNGDNNLSFDFSELNTGIYIVKIGDERNPTHRKLIIEK